MFNFFMVFSYQGATLYPFLRGICISGWQFVLVFAWDPPIWVALCVHLHVVSIYSSGALCASLRGVRITRWHSVYILKWYLHVWQAHSIHFRTASRGQGGTSCIFLCVIRMSGGLFVRILRGICMSGGPFVCIFTLYPDVWDHLFAFGQGYPLVAQSKGSVEEGTKDNAEMVDVIGQEEEESKLIERSPSEKK